MQKHGEIPPPRSYASWWRQLLVLLSVAAVLVITSVSGVGVGIVLAIVAVADTAGVLVVTIVRAHRHHESFGDAAAALLLTEHGRWRMEERSRGHADHRDSSNPSS